MPSFRRDRDHKTVNDRQVRGHRRHRAGTLAFPGPPPAYWRCAVPTGTVDPKGDHNAFIPVRISVNRNYVKALLLMQPCCEPIEQDLHMCVAVSLEESGNPCVLRIHGGNILLRCLRRQKDRSCRSFRFGTCTYCKWKDRLFLHAGQIRSHQKPVLKSPRRRPG